MNNNREPLIVDVGLLREQGVALAQAIGDPDGGDRALVGLQSLVDELMVYLADGRQVTLAATNAQPLAELQAWNVARAADGGGTRPVEMIVCQAWSGGDAGEWFTDYVDIPAGTPEHRIESVAAEAMFEKLQDCDDVALVAVYHLPEPGEEE